MNYYNEFDPFASEWLKKLIKAGELPDGEVDTRSITEVKANDIKGFTQCHFFAGIGGWSLALKLAGWESDRPVWTGSCPCQPFSTAGKQKGKADDRHLWPVWFNLIRQCRPSIIFGEQVSSSITHGWLDGVYDDMEAENYAVGSAVLPACSIGSPHKRDRLFFVGNPQLQGRNGGKVVRSVTESQKERRMLQSEGSIESSTMGDPKYHGCIASSISGSQRPTIQYDPEGSYCSSKFERANIGINVAKSFQSRLEGLGGYDSPTQGRKGQARYNSPFDSSKFNWIECPDRKIRPVKSEICLLANGIPNRVGKLRGYGNAIVPQVAAEFIKAVM